MYKFPILNYWFDAECLAVFTLITENLQKPQNPSFWAFSKIQASIPLPQNTHQVNLFKNPSI